MSLEEARVMDQDTDTDNIADSAAWVLSASTIFLLSFHRRSSIPREVPFFALVIGIDDYEQVPKLRGATADADSVDEFLRNHLNVPRGHIINLRNATATRERILQAFRKLQSTPEIKRDNAIFIYFAGYGSETDAPVGWPTAGSKIQVLLPQDVDVVGPAQFPIPPIPDRTLAALLEDLAREKGNNIVSLCSRSSATFLFWREYITLSSDGCT
jgi:Caspase domain